MIGNQRWRAIQPPAFAYRCCWTFVIYFYFNFIQYSFFKFILNGAIFHKKILSFMLINSCSDISIKYIYDSAKRFEYYSCGILFNKFLLISIFSNLLLLFLRSANGGMHYSCFEYVSNLFHTCKSNKILLTIKINKIQKDLVGIKTALSP